MDGKFTTALFVGLHLVTLVFLVAIISDYHFIDPTLMAEVQAHDGLDTIAVASQLGRFDFLSVLLAAFALLAVFGGLFGFGFVRGESQATARQTAERIAEERLTELLSEFRKSNDDLRAILRSSEEPSSTPPAPEYLRKADADSETSHKPG